MTMDDVGAQMEMIYREEISKAQSQEQADFTRRWIRDYTITDEANDYDQLRKSGVVKVINGRE